MKLLLLGMLGLVSGLRLDLLRGDELRVRGRLGQEWSLTTQSDEKNEDGCLDGDVFLLN